MSDVELYVAVAGRLTVQLRAVDPDGDTITFAVDTPPTLGTYTLSPAGSFSYTAGGLGGDDLLRIVASDGLAVSAPATVTIHILSSSKVWRGDFSVLWNEARNWSPQGPPSPSDDVHVPAGLVQPVITASTTIGRLVVDSNATVTLGTSAVLQVSGGVFAHGSVTGAGQLNLVGDGGLEGNLSKILIDGAHIIARGNVVVTTSLTMTSGSLTIGSHTVRSDGNLTIYGGLFKMQDADGRVIAGTVHLGGDDTNGVLSAGELHVAGDLSWNAGLHATGTHVLVLEGSTDHSLTGDPAGTLNDVRAEGGGDLVVMSLLNVEGAFTDSGAHDIRGTGTLNVRGPMTTGSGTGLLIDRLVIHHASGTTLLSPPTYNVATTIFAGTGQTISALGGTSYADLWVTGQAAAEPGAGAVLVSGDLLIDGGALGATRHLFIQGGLTTVNGGSLRMTTAAVRVQVEQAATLSGLCPTDGMTEGVLKVAGNVSASAAALRASGNHELHMGSGSVQSLAVAGGLDGESGSYVRHLVVTGGGRVNFEDAVAVTGRVEVASGQLVGGTASTLRVDGALQVASGAAFTVDRVELSSPEGTARVDGSLDAATVAFLGPGATIKGGLPYVNIEVAAAGVFGEQAVPINVSGNLLVTGNNASLALYANFFVNGGCRLDGAGAAVLVRDSQLDCNPLETANGATLMMDNDAGEVVSRGTAGFSGAMNPEDVTAGLLTLNAGMSILSPSGFVASGTHRTVFQGSNDSLYVEQAFTVSELNDVEIDALVTVNVNSNVTIAGDLLVEGTLVVTPQNTCEVRGDFRAVGASTLTVQTDAALNVLGSCTLDQGATVTGFTCP